MTCDADTDELPSFIRGDTWVIAVELTDEGVAEDLTGSSIIVSLKKSLSDPDPGALEYIYPVPAGPDAEAGKARVEVPSDITDILAGKYWMALKRVIPGSPPIVWTFFLQKDIEVRANVSDTVA